MHLRQKRGQVDEAEHLAADRIDAVAERELLVGLRPMVQDGVGVAGVGNVQQLQPLLPELAVARAGDLVTYDNSHVGIVAVDQPVNSGMIETIEGNTNGAGGRDSANGDGVWRKTRRVELVRRYVRLLP